MIEPRGAGVGAGLHIQIMQSVLEATYLGLSNNDAQILAVRFSLTLAFSIREAINLNELPDFE